MAEPLRHRGPDDAGFYVDPLGRCGLAFRRLAIIDLATGNQPLSNETGRIWSVFNGEIYNYRALRSRLAARGHLFRTLGDAETLVHLYEQSGQDMFGQLAGMFAIALWDEERGRLVLARDRFGKKPLTYGVHGGRLYFASEAKALLALPGFPRRISPQALHDYLVLQYVPTPHSIYRGVAKLPPGCCLEISAALRTPLDSLPSPRTYYVPPAPAAAGHVEHARDYRAALEELDLHLRAAVEKRLMADVPLGAFLSGGIDSAVVVALMRALGVSPLRTFTIGFDEAAYDERGPARLVAQRFETEHHEERITPSAIDLLDTLAWHFDEPFADSSAIPTYYVARTARRHVTVALTGDGGDEAFAGYDRYRAAQLAACAAWLPSGLRAWTAARLARGPAAPPKSWRNRLRRFAEGLALPESRRYFEWMRVFDPADLSAGYQPDFAARIESAQPVEWLRSLYASSADAPADRAIHADFRSYLPFDLLTKVDLASMAVGLECRAPLLDHELVAFAMRLPLHWRLGRGADGGKRILRDWARRYLPAAITRRRKSGFGVPLARWFRTDLAARLRDRFDDPSSLLRRVFRAEWLQRLLAEHQSGQRNHDHRLWALLMLDAWQRTWGATFE